MFMPLPNSGPDYLNEPKFEKFRTELDKLEWTEGILPQSSIDHRYNEARLAFASENDNYFPLPGTDADKRLKRAVFEARTRNLYEHLRTFEKTVEATGMDGAVIDIAAPEMVMNELKNYRTRVSTMSLTPLQTSLFLYEANCIAEEALWRAELPIDRINELLGPLHRPDRPAPLRARPYGLDIG